MKTAALDQVPNSSRSWLAVTLGIVDRLNKERFSIGDVYQHEAKLSVMFPNNHNVRAKLRQQLQLLRDLGLLEFLGGGQYSAKI